MKKWMVLGAIIGAAGIACGVQEQPVNIGEAHPWKLQGTSCSIDTSQYISSGTLNVGEADSYVGSFSWSSGLSSTGTDVNGETVDTARNDFYGSEVDITYTSTPDLGLGSAVVPGLWILPAGGGSSGNYFSVDVIPPTVGKQIAAKLPTVSGSKATVYATLKMKGKLGSGSEAESNSVTFPIDVYDIAITSCPTGEVKVFQAGCFFGQNGADYACVPAAADGGT